MSTRKLTKAVQQLFQHISSIAKSLSKGLINWLLRAVLMLGRQPLLAESGFVLPTTVLLLLVLTLTVGSIGFRTYTRTVQTIGERQQRVIFNAATPAVDRAKSKLEYLFDVQKDPRFPGGVPSETQLLGMLFNDGRTLQPSNIVVDHHPLGRPTYDPYNFPGETRVVLPGDPRVANAWRYRTDTDGDGTEDATVVYSILFKTDAIANMRNASESAVAGRASRQMVRHGPLSNSPQANAACQVATNVNAAPPVEQGWFRDETNTSVLRKNFQVNAYVLPDSKSGTVTTLEFHQDRQVNRGNKWGAWFRNDLEIFPGPQFNWNGAMHTEGNLFVQSSNGFNSYLISSPASCLYTKEASEITVTNIAANPALDVPAFQGQFISGTVKENTFGTPAATNIHLFTTGSPPYINSGAAVDFDDASDSVVSAGLPADYALDPVILQTQDVSVARNITNPAANRAPTWDASQFVDKGRMKNLQQKAPYVDDSYRADNRSGPKPRYAGEPIAGVIGQDISNIPALSGNAPAAGADNTSVGLDGYWERRARREGMRIIVGERLELGDPAGWGGTEGSGTTQINQQEPLKPWALCSTGNTTICNEARQRRTLWDNLAAVQSAAVYHSATPGEPLDYPVACIASTVHPGTPTTLAKSSTFENLIYSGSTPAYSIPGYEDGPGPNTNDGVIQTDFFRGRGTNGWEFAPPPEAEFRNPSSPLMTALKNLATFAGDPNGGAPSFTPVQDAQSVHPAPGLSMWGDFSMLRRVLTQGGAYDTLSPADKTVLHTAGCTIGMLAYNIDYLENFKPDDPSIPSTLIGTANLPGDKTGLRGRIRDLLDNNVPELKGSIPPIRNIRTDELDKYYLSISAIDKNNPEGVVRLLEQWRDALIAGGKPPDQIDLFNQQIYLAQMIITKEQVARDRWYGFFGSGNTDGSQVYAREPLGYCTKWIADNGNSTTKKMEPLAALCSDRPRYPILYSLFPGRDDNPPKFAPGNFDVSDAIYTTNFEPHGEVFDNSRDSIDSTDPYINSVNSGETYQVVNPFLLALKPRELSNWVLPKASGTPTSGNDTPTSNGIPLIKICSGPCLRYSSGYTSSTPDRLNANESFLQIAFKDSALYNGRELMSVRVMDMNLDLMRKTAYRSDFWLPLSGIIYAFREDAVSELEIVRPAGSSSWSACKTSAQITSAGCRMKTGNVTAYASTDPPISEDNAISPKPVDYYADPDRRPYGFRLKNGSKIGRTGDGLRGLSLISDNPVYIQGDFNLHQSASGTRLEEFVPPLLANDFGNFYSRSGNDGNFAKTGDQWRPTEILADAITLLSDNYCDGSIKDGVVTAGLPLSPTSPGVKQPDFDQYGCGGTNNNRLTSYLNQNRPSAAPTAFRGVSWMHANLADSISVDPTPANPLLAPGYIPRLEGDSPIFFTRLNNPMRMSSADTGADYTSGYYTMDSVRPLITGAGGTRMNGIFISGIVPSRAFQAYGGLHNFPRFQETWGGTLFISGSFLQLNFSTSATAPFDLEAYEPGTTPTLAAEYIKYYGAPTRSWGYDVGLQIAPAGPLAQRFVAAETKRSEFYSEPTADDPYIKNLCATISGAVCN